MTVRGIDPIMTDKKALWEGTHNITQVLSFNATAENGENMTWTLNTNLSCFSIEQNANGTKAWVNGTPSPDETNKWYWTYVEVSETLKPKKLDYNNFTTYINNSAPVLNNKIEDEIIVPQGTKIDYLYVCVDANGDPTTCTVVGNDDLEIIEESPTILYGTPLTTGNYDVSVTVTDGFSQDSDTFTLKVLEKDGAKGGGLKGFGFSCEQINQYEIKCYVTSTKDISRDRLKFKWEVENKEYYGDNITHQFEESFDWGDNVTVNMTVYINTGLSMEGIELGKVSKVITSSYVPIWFFILLIVIIVFIYLIFKKR